MNFVTYVPIKSIQNDRKQFRFSMLLIIFQNAEDLLNK